MKSSSLILGAFLALSFLPSQALSANLVTGVSGCIMKSGGSAGYGQAGGTIWSQIREPASGEYAEWQEPYTFGKKTFWRTDYYNAQGSGNSKYYNTAFWGQIEKKGGVGLFMNTTPGAADSWAMPAGPTDSAGVDGWHYYRGSYYGYIGAGTSTRFNAYGIYRTRMGYVTTPTVTVFEDCKSNSNASNGNWISNRFVTSQEINNAFTQFEKNIETKINEKKITLSLLTPVVSSTARASTKKTSSSSSTFFTGVRKSKTQKEVSGSSARDATSHTSGFR